MDEEKLRFVCEEMNWGRPEILINMINSLERGMLHKSKFDLVTPSFVFVNSIIVNKIMSNSILNI